jgi:heme exporter protein C
MKINWFKYASPTAFYPVAGRLVPWLGAAALLLILFSLYWGFFETPERLGGTNPQKEYYRIIFIHVPAAWMSMWLYLVMAAWAAIGLVFNTRLSFMMANSVAPTGAIFTFIALWTGAFWGRPSWGTYWDWDPRLTSELILFFLYIGYIALHSAIDDTRRADRAAEPVRSPASALVAERYREQHPDGDADDDPGLLALLLRGGILPPAGHHPDA